jgi:hypothetical protein
VRNEKKPTKEKREKSPSSKVPQRSTRKGATGPLPDIDKQSLLKKREEIEEVEKFIGMLRSQTRQEENGK